MRSSLGWLFVVPLAAAAQGTLLERITGVVRNNMQHLPNYTCTMTVDRLQRPIGAKRFHPLDRIRLDIVLMDNHELFAWPGSRHFEDKPIYEMVGNGFIGTGEFGLFLQTVFLSGAARFHFSGTEESEGRRLYHYLYEVPRAVSRYEIRLPTVGDTVGFGGSVWIDPDSIDLVRLEILAREIPARLPLVSGSILINYGRMQVGSGDFLLPRSVQEEFVSDGQEARNQISFSGCHQYHTESEISFGNVSKIIVPPPPERMPLELPPNVKIESKLVTPLDSERAARGDPFEAIVTKPVLRKGTVVIPQGAKIHGRVDGIVQSSPPDACTGVILIPDRIEFHGREGAFTADQVSLPFLNPSRLAHDPCPFVPEPGTAILQFHASTFQVTAGQVILWRTGKPDAQR